MNLVQRINPLGRAPNDDTARARPKPIMIERTSAGPATAAALDMERRITELADEIAQLEIEVEDAAVRRKAADAAVRDLSEQIAAGRLEDPEPLAAALRNQRELAADTHAADKLEQLRAERSHLQERVYDLRHKAAGEAYNEAVMAYAKACTPLLKLAQQIRDTAAAAGVPITEHNSKHLIGTWLQIGGAVIDVPRD